MDKNSVTKSFIVGYVARDPEMRYTASGSPVVTLMIPTNSSYKNGEGEFVEETTWHHVTFFDKRAEVIDKYVRKGSLVHCDARLKPEPRIWEDSDGNPRVNYEFRGENITFLSTPKKEEETEGITEDEIPF